MSASDQIHTERLPPHLVEFILASASEHHAIKLLIGESVPKEVRTRKSQPIAGPVEG
jgi:hypothetical protein